MSTRRSIYCLQAATNRYDKRIKEPQFERLRFALLLLVTMLLCISIDMVHDHCMLIIITGNSIDANNYHNTDDYKFRVISDIRVMFRYLLEMHVLVLFLTGFPNLELYFSVLCFQFLILESTKQVVIWNWDIHSFQQ